MNFLPFFHHFLIYPDYNEACKDKITKGTVVRKDEIHGIL